MEKITLGEAFAHAFDTPAYVIWLIIGTAVAIALFIAGSKKYNRDQEVSGGVLLMWGLAVAIFLFALLYKPAGTAANTTKEMAARGVYID